MTSNRNAIADYFTYILSSNNEHINLRFLDNEIWANINQISKIYDEDENVINNIIIQVSQEDDFDLTTFSRQIDGITFYAFDIIIQVGFKIKNQNAIQFRQWATRLLSEYIIKGFALDDLRLKNCSKVFDDDFFVGLQNEYDEIFVSQRTFTQKVTDLFATAYDYEKDSLITNQFFKKISCLAFSMNREDEKSLIDFYLKTANKKLSDRIPLTMSDWIYYFTPIFDSKYNSNLASIIKNKDYFSKPTYYENLDLNNKFANPNTQHFEDELFEILKKGS